MYKNSGTKVQIHKIINIQGESRFCIKVVENNLHNFRHSR